MSGAIPSLPRYGFKAWCLVKHRDNLFLRSETYGYTLVASIDIMDDDLVGALKGTVWSIFR
jgi:hypothetical protein